MENQILQTFAIGDWVVVVNDYQEAQIRGRVGQVICFESMNNVGVDFKKVIPGMTWDLDRKLPLPTGRYIYSYGLGRVIKDWDE